MIRCLSAYALLVTISASAFAAVDQEFFPSTPNSGGNVVGSSLAVDWAQTFTVGLDGVLTSFDLSLGRHTGVTQPLLYDIRRTVAGVPVESDSSADILATGSIASSAITASASVPPTYRVIHIELGSKSFPVANNDVLAIVLRSDDPGVTGYGYAWRANHFDTFFNFSYPRGNAFDRTSGLWVNQPDFDMLFRTYVIPEPSTALFAPIAVALIATRRRKSVPHNRV